MRGHPRPGAPTRVHPGVPAGGQFAAQVKAESDESLTVPVWADRNAFRADMATLNAEFERLGAVMTLPDGATVIDPSQAPDHLVRTYGRLTSYGYSNRMIDAPALAAKASEPPSRQRPARATIRLAKRSPDGTPVFSETQAQVVGGFGVHQAESGDGWVATHVASGLRVTPTYDKVRKIDAVRMSTAMMTMAEAVPGYWDQERPFDQTPIGQLPTTPERQARYGNADGMVFPRDIGGIASGLVFSKDAADPDYQLAQAKFEAITGRTWSPQD